ncbi:MAG TPA: YbhN family protein [Patescibacteria group bacterium]|nr:YbhN family protein [Patescibacteria group bacterium]
MTSKNGKITAFRILLLLAALVGLYYLLPQLGAFRSTFTVLRHASWPWLVGVLVASSLSFFASAVTQFAAGALAGRLSDVVLLQFAGSFVNHFFPFSVGGISLNSRYYKKLGKSQTQAITIATIPIVFGIVTTIIMVAIVSPITLMNFFSKSKTNHVDLWLILVLAVGIAIIMFLVLRYRQKAGKIVQEALSSLRSVNNGRQLALLTAGSVALTLLSSTALLASVEAVHASVTLIGIFTIYVTAALVSNIAPTPDGIGATEAVLVLGLAAVKVSLPQAAAAMLIYRFFMFWLPIVPGAMALSYINRKRISRQ